MKRIMVFAAAVLLPVAVSAVECRPVADYKVSRIAYKARSLEQSLQHIVRGTPYRGAVEGGAKTPARTKRLAGPLSLTLDQLAKQFDVTWQQDGCLLRFSEKPTVSVARTQKSSSITEATPIRVASVAMPAHGQAAIAKSEITAWSLIADQPIHKQFADWARVAGWTFEWRLEKSWMVPAATQFTGSFDEALSKAVEALHAQGKPVRLIIWEGNRFAEIVDVDAK